jgi:hypothetical protein
MVCSPAQRQEPVRHTAATEISRSLLLVKERNLGSFFSGKGGDEFVELKGCRNVTTKKRKKTAAAGAQAKVTGSRLEASQVHSGLNLSRDGVLPPNRREMRYTKQIA